MRDLDLAAPETTTRIADRPIHALLVPIPAACFVGTLVTDVVYWQTADIFWSDMSGWLLTAGLVVAVLAVITGLTNFFGDQRIRALRAAWIYGIGNAIALILEIINALVHTRDAYTSVVPTGLMLSAASVLILLVTTWHGLSMVYPHSVGVRVAEDTRI